MKRLRYIMLLAGLMSLSLQTIYAQRITRSFRNTSMSEALTILAKSTKDYRINFMYDELEDFTVTTSIVKRTAPDAIRQIMGFYPMKMTIDGENIFVECTQKTPTKMIGRIIDLACIICIACRNIAHATYSYYRLSRLAGNHELAVLIRHAAIYQ